MNKSFFLTFGLILTVFLTFGAQRVQITGPGEAIITGGSKVTITSPGIAVTPAPAVTNIGDILSFTVRATGGDADIVISGFTTNCTYNYGIVQSNTTQPDAKIVLTVTSEGYVGTNLSTTTRTVLGTITSRLPYPAETATEGPGTTKDETVSGTNLVVRVFLDDYIYADDNTGAGKSGTAVSVSIASGFCTNATGGYVNNAISGLTVVNNSTVTYPLSYGQYDNVAGTLVYSRVKTNFNLAANARSRLGISAVKFTAYGVTSSNTVTSIVTNQTGTQRSGSALYANSYQTTIPITGFTQGETILCNWIAYPSVGDAGSVFDSSTKTNILEECNGQNQITLLCDKNDTFDVPVYVSVTGNDTTGNGTSGNPYATISKASTNGNIIYLAAGTNSFGFAGTRRASNDWTTIQPAPGVDRTNAIVLLNATTKSYNIARLRIYNTEVRLAGTTSWADGSNTNIICWDSCLFNSSGIGAPTTSPAYRSLVSYFLNCTGDLGPTDWALRSFSTERLAYQFDGCSFGSGGVGNSYYRVIANKTTVSGWGMADKLATNPAPADDNQLIENNWISMGGSSADPILVMGSVLARTRGTSISGNIFEKATGTAPAVQIYADSTTNNASEIHIIHNTVTGERLNYAYNETGTTSLTRLNWILRFNALRDKNIKDDTFGTPNANRIGGWMVGYGIGSVGNFYEIQTFSGEYDGLNSVEIGDDGIEYVDNASFTGDASGFGDYTPGPSSILRNRIPSGLATFSVDLFGTSWGNTGNGSSGAIQRISDL